MIKQSDKGPLTLSSFISPSEVEREPGPGQFESDGEEEGDLRLDCRSTEAVPGEVESSQSQGQTPHVAALPGGAGGAAELDTVEAVEGLGRLPGNFFVEPENIK